MKKGKKWKEENRGNNKRKMKEKDNNNKKKWNNNSQHRCFKLNQNNKCVLNPVIKSLPK